MSLRSVEMDEGTVMITVALSGSLISFIVMTGGSIDHCVLSDFVHLLMIA